MLYLEPPDNFDIQAHIVGAFVERAGKLLFLKRSSIENSPFKWCVPGGRVEEGEDLLVAAKRELNEETGIISNEVNFFKTVFIRHGGFEFAYHMFFVKDDEGREIVLRYDEHTEFQWLKPLEALELDLIDGEDACIRLAYCTI